MNERIRELLAKAYLFCYTDGTVSLFGETYCGQAEIEEFARLVTEDTVRKCVDLVNEHLQHNNPNDSLLALKIKEHFGVEL